MPSNAFNVYNSKGRLIDTVFSTDTDALEVKRSLVNHDGYDSDIRVVKVRKAKAKKAPVLADFGPSGPVPHYNHKTDGDYSAWLVANNID
jgi:hypothetical protein